MLKRRAILHIGTEKTGTTSIQAAMAQLRESLPEHGFCYSRSAGQHNHLRLAAWAGDPKRVAELRAKIAHPNSPVGPLERFPADLDAEMRGLPDAVHTVVFSNEHCQSRLTSVESVQKLKTLLDPYFSEFLILVYLRRQDELALSQVSNILRGGNPVRTLLPEAPQSEGLFDYEALLRRWATVFGKGAMRPRLYGREHFVDGDLIRDFLSACGLEAVSPPGPSPRRNQSLSAPAQEFLRRLNAMPPPGFTRRDISAALRILQQEFTGPGMRPSRREAEEFMAQFGEANERVRAEHFPERRTLFSGGFESYGEQATTVDDTEVLAVAMAVVSKLVGTNAKRPRPNDARRARRTGAQGRGAAPPEHRLLVQ